MYKDRDRRSRRLGLTSFTVAASSLLALLIGVGFAVLLWAVADSNSATSDRRASRAELVEAGVMEQLLVDLETGQRGYIITEREDFLAPWVAARKALPEETRRFTEGATSPEQRRAAERIARGVQAFLDGYSIPLVEMVQRGDSHAVDPKQTAQGKDDVDELRAQFDTYVKDERKKLAAREDTAAANSRRAVLAAALGLAASTVVVAVFTVLQHRAVVRPVRGAAAAARELASGDLTVRVAPSKVAEIGTLGSSFNSMAASLQESRRRIMENTEAVHRRTARDLHDGAQQRLVSLMIGLRLARELLPDTEASAAELLDRSIDNAQTAIDELRELASGIYPLVLTAKGLVAAVRDLAHRCPVLTVVESEDERRISTTVEANAYFVVAEAVTNAVKHARASRIDVFIAFGDMLRIDVSDDGIGGVDSATPGSGMAGLADRVAAFDGKLTIDSPSGGGSTLQIRIPLPD
ncbi:CHASE3 domain-containing protein [Streptomyces sp. NPDC008125]|uniref:sensor histidine kinase n=1 Tax=Streptomyces sp. NPDC008125 TaxID=3364811 RepID=UPI0036E1399A